MAVVFPFRGAWAWSWLGGALMVWSIARLVSPGLSLTESVVFASLLLSVLVIHVLVHEVAHAAVALCASGTAEVKVSPLFGLCEYEAPFSRVGEAALALAGPAANLAAAAAAHAAALLLGSDGPELVTGALQYATAVGLAMAAFNLLPIPPLDGGRAVRALRPRSGSSGR